MELPADLRIVGPTLVLERAHVGHARDLARHATHETFELFATGRPSELSEEGMARYVEHVMRMPNAVPMTVLLAGEAIGMTAFMDLREGQRALEVGTTWYGPSFRGTHVNPECKLLMLGYAFDTLGVERVQLKTDARNIQSQKAIEKLGAVREGLLRKHLTMPNGFQRDTALYSIIRDEWPAVRQGLLDRLR